MCVNWGSKYHEEPHQFYMMIYTMPINHFLPFYVGEREYGGGGAKGVNMLILEVRTPRILISQGE